MQEIQTRTVRVGRRTWQVRHTWQSRGQVRRWGIVRTEQRRAGWQAGRWQEITGRHCQVQRGEVISEVWQ